jgi:RNA polymerase sigma-70 factor (ECF subfamily)
MVDNIITARFNEIYDSTNKKALAFIAAKCGNMEDVNDILQETYMELYDTILKKGVDYIENDEAFVIQIAKRKVQKHYSFTQRMKAQLSLSVVTAAEEMEMIEYDDMDLEESVCTSELAAEIEGLLAKKPLDVRKIFFLRFSLELTLAEIAELIGMSESQVKNKLYRTINEIRTYYREGETE